MARVRNNGETLSELEAQGGERLPKSKRLALPHVVEEFLSLTLSEPEGFDLMSGAKQAEIAREQLGFYKAQEKLREFIALGGISEISDLADVRDDRQIRPLLIANLRTWMM
jgi:hypothetical protein